MLYNFISIKLYCYLSALIASTDIQCDDERHYLVNFRSQTSLTGTEIITSVFGW